MGLLDVVGGGEEGEVMTAGADKCVVRFDWQRRSVRDRWKAHSMPVERLLYDPHSRAVFTASRDSNIRMFTSSPSPSSSSSPAAAAAASLSSAAPADVIFRGHTLSVSALCFDSVLSSSLSSSPPTVLVSGGRDYSLRWWDIAHTTTTTNAHPPRQHRHHPHRHLPTPHPPLRQHSRHRPPLGQPHPRARPTRTTRSTPLP